MDKLSLCFNGDDFTNFVSFVKSMSTRDKAKGIRAVVLHVENNSLVCRAVDDTSDYIEYNVELYKTDNQIEEPFAVSVTDLAALVKCSSGDKFSIRKSYNQFEFNVIGNGWLPFKVVEADLSKYIVNGVESNIGAIESAKLRNAISSVLGYTQEYTYARDKYIQFTKSQMLVTSRLSSVVIKDSFVEMTLHRDCAAMLKTLLKDDFELKINKVESAVEMLSFIGPKFKFTVIASGIESPDVKYIDDINDYLSVDCNELYKLAIFSEEYPASKHIIGIKIKDKQCQVNVKNVLAAKHVSTIKSEGHGNVVDTFTEAEIPAHNLLKALKLFQDKRSRDVNIYITDEMLKSQNSVILFDDNTQAIINIYNR